MHIIVAHFDGSCTNTKNDGDIGIGYHAEFLGKPQGSLMKVSKGGFVGSNNEAEYMALIELLTSLSVKHSNCDILVRGDSQLVISQVNGELRTHNESLKTYLDKVKELQKNFQSLRIEHVPREKNKLADDLSKKAVTKSLQNYYKYKF